jgi:hypothetical protein
MPDKKSFIFSRTLVAGLFLAGLFSSALMPTAVWKSTFAAHVQVFDALDVIINEVAWSGTVSNSLSEWMELYNPGTVDIDLSGWKLVADDGEPEILLSGYIRAGGYYLLERNNDLTISDIPADLVYTTGGLDLKNETLRLFAPD